MAESTVAAKLLDDLAGYVDLLPVVTAADATPRPTTDEELYQWCLDVLGVRIPRTKVCAHHCAPFQALADAYFARVPRAVWKASRELGGKSVLLATLSMAEAITLGAGVTLLGGSGEQSERVHAYMQGLETMRGRFWAWPGAPRHLLRSDPTVRKTRLSNGGWITALMASPRSVRGPHPQRLRGDEIDEMDPTIWDAAQGQPKPDHERGILEQVVGSSTLHHANGTMARELKTAQERKWPIYEWCYRETMAEGGFVTEDEIARKRASISVMMWNIEYDLQEPSPEGRAIIPEVVERTFDPKRGTFPGEEGRLLIFEPPVWELDPAWKKLDREARIRLRAKMTARYAAGADWGKLRDHTNIFVFRADTVPMQIVAFAYYGRRPYPEMFKHFNDVVERYDATSAHDATGLGTVADDYVRDGTVGVSMQGMKRRNLFSNYIVGLEEGEVVGPRIETAYRAHLYCTTDDLYGTGHPPDEFVAGALAYAAATGHRELLY